MKNIITASSLSSSITYVIIIFTWISLLYNENTEFFFEICEKKVGIEVFIFFISFFLIGIGNNSPSVKDKKVYLITSVVFFILGILLSWRELELFVSIMVLLVNH